MTEDIIDFHAHAFPDELAPRAMKLLAEAPDVNAFLDGTIKALSNSMERNGSFGPAVAKFTKESFYYAFLRDSAHRT